MVKPGLLSMPGFSFCIEGLIVASLHDNRT